MLFRIVLFIYRFVFSCADRRKEKVWISEQGAVTTWFHAASVGEFETLHPLIVHTLTKQKNVALTAFSPSLIPHVDDWLSGLPQEFKQRIKYLGMSPRSDAWSDLFLQYGPKVFITTRYEAWPGLWFDLLESNCQLVVIGARLRSSLKSIKIFFKCFAQHFPRMTLVAHDHKDSTALQKYFVDAHVVTLDDPRLIRIYDRLIDPTVRETRIVEAVRKCAHDYFVLGNSWNSDLLQLTSGDFFKKYLWVIVPHQWSGLEYENQKNTLRKLNVQWLETAQLSEQDLLGLSEKYYSLQQTGQAVVILVNEPKLLLALYSQSGLNWVGGGFGKSVHAFTEVQAVHRPVVSGPNGTERFSETEVLLKQGWLRIMEADSVECSIQESYLNFKQGQHSAVDWKVAKADIMNSWIETLKQFDRL